MEANILAVITILVAGYTLLSEERRIDLFLRIGLLDKLLLFSALVASLYVTFLPVLSHFNIAIPLPWLWGLTPNLVIFSMILLVLLYLTFKLLDKRLPHSRIKYWNKMSLQLLRQRKYKELSYLVDKYYNQFCFIHKDKWYDTLRSKLPSSHRDEFDSLLRGKQYKTSFIIRVGTKIIDWVLPSKTKLRECSASGLKRLLSTKSFIRYYSLHNPQACMELTLLPLNISEKFSDDFLESLMSDSESTLYREVRDTQQISMYTGYNIQPTNPLLSFYLEDLNFAVTQQIWKPIGDSAAKYISKQTGGDRNYYNQPYHWSYEDEERWVCPIYITLHFFDIMVQRAIFINYPDHMWLRYYYTLLEHIIKKYQPSPAANQSNGLPTRYDYLIDEIFKKCISWLEVAVDIKIKLVDKDKRIWPIPVGFSASVLGELLRLILQAGNITDSRCTEQLAKVIRLSNKLEGAGLQRLNQEIANELIPNWGIEQNNKIRLKKCFSKVDPYETSLNSTLSIEIKKI